MNWKTSLEGLEEFSDNADARTRRIARDKTQVLREETKPDVELTKEYEPLVAEVYKYFAQKTGGKYRLEKSGDTPTFCIEKVADIQDFERRNVFPDVRMLSPRGVMVEVPLLAEDSSSRCRQLFEMHGNTAEGFYEYRRQDDEGGWINSRGYFIPFEVFTQQKLAKKLAEMYKEAMRNYLKELRG